MNKVLVVGDIYIETQFFVDTIPNENQFMFASESVTSIGSKTINAARTLVKMGDSVSYYGFVGDDAESELVNKGLGDYKIISLVSKLSHGITGKIAVITPNSHNSSIVLSAGVNNLITPEHIGLLTPHLRQFDGLYTSTALPLESLYTLIDLCREYTLAVFLDIPNQHAQLDLHKLSSVSFFMPNRQELALLTNKPMDSIEDVMQAVFQLRTTIKGTIIVTLDRDGCVFLEKDSDTIRHFPARPVDAVDETGAGDIFRGVFVNTWLITHDIESSIMKALDLATASVNIRGVSASIENLGSVK